MTQTAELDMESVSYTHLDVYKRQDKGNIEADRIMKQAGNNTMHRLIFNLF